MNIKEIALKVANAYDKREIYFPYRDDLVNFAEARIAELEKEVELDEQRVADMMTDVNRVGLENDELRQQLAARELVIKQLHSALSSAAVFLPENYKRISIIPKALAIQPSTTYLDAYVAEKVKSARIIDEKQIAYLFEERSALTRQRDLAVSAIENLVKQKGRHNTEIAYKKLVDVLAAIKESENN